MKLTKIVNTISLLRMNLLKDRHLHKLAAQAQESHHHQQVLLQLLPSHRNLLSSNPCIHLLLPSLQRETHTRCAYSMTIQ